MDDIFGPRDERVEAADTVVPAQVDPPVPLLLAAMAVVSASLVCWLFGWRLAFDTTTPVAVLYGTGYVLATFVGLGLTAAFARTDQTRRQMSTYSPTRWLGPAQKVVAAACIGAAAANVWNLATLLA